MYSLTAFKSVLPGGDVEKYFVEQMVARTLFLIYFAFRKVQEGNELIRENKHNINDLSYIMYWKSSCETTR